MAARLAPDNVRRMHQSLHHLVADALWSDEVLLDGALDTVLGSMLRQGPVVAWVVDDTGFPKKGAALGGRHTPVLRAGGQAGQLPGSGKPFGYHRNGQYAGGFSRAASNRTDAGTGCARRGGAGRCGLWR
jgi:hypothetical protein